MSKHTAGPWNAERCHVANIVDIYDGEIIRDGDGWNIPHGTNLIATVASVGDVKTTDANARLIAAAPELAEALRDGVELVNDIVASWESGDLAGAVNDLRMWAEDQARSALEKAGVTL